MVEQRDYRAGMIQSAFVRLNITDLKDIVVAAQCLDNQWVPNWLLRAIIEDGRSQIDIQEDLKKNVRAEYIRSLINAEQVVINRAFIKNTPSVFDDFTQTSPRKKESNNRKVFKSFLDTGIIIPFLFNESTPVDDSEMETSDVGTSAWRQICQETMPQCLRFDWNDELNKTRIRETLAGQFHLFSTTAKSLGGAPLAELRGHDRPIPDKDEQSKFWLKLHEVAEYANGLEKKGGLDEDGRPAAYVTRQQIYERFICVDGTKIIEGRYDLGKPFSADLKLLFDLVYNLNLPDGLGIHSLTPFDTPSRTVLLGWEASQLADKGNDITAEDIHTLISRATFAAIQVGLNFHSFYDLELEDVKKTRKTKAWSVYIRSVYELINNPPTKIDSKENISTVYNSYFDVLKKIALIRATRRAEIKERAWKPYIEFVVDVASPVAGHIAAGKLSVMMGAEPGQLEHKFFSHLVGAATKRAAPVVIRMIIRGATISRELPTLGTSFVIMRGRMADAEKQWCELRKIINSNPIFRERAMEGPTSSRATISPNPS